MEDRIASFTSFEFSKAFDFFDHHQTLECHASSDLTKGASRKKNLKIEEFLRSFGLMLASILT